MHVHHKLMSDLIKKYAQPSDDNDAAVRAAVRVWRIEVMSGVPVTIPGMPGGTYAELADFDQWRDTKFPRLYVKAD